MSILLRLPILLLRLVCQGILIALAQVWSNKIRSLLTMTGIIIGVASVTAVIAALTGLKSNVLHEFEALGTNKIYVLPYRPMEGSQRYASWRSIRFLPKQFDGLLEHCPSVDSVCRVIINGADIKHGQNTAESATILGVDATWNAIENRPLKLGRPFSHIDITQGTNVCMIDEKLQEKLQLNRDCIGQTILIGNRSYIVVGLLEPRASNSMFGGMGRSYEVQIPFGTAWRETQSMNYAMVACKHPELSEEARAELKFFLRTTRNLKPGQMENFQLEAVEEHLRRFQEVATIITVVASGIVGISLLVGGVGIMNIMLVSVSERTREIGLRKAIGARASEILLQFLIEAVMLCLLGGLVGVLMGHLLAGAIAAIPGAHLERAFVPMWAIAMSFGFAAVVGVTFGMFPAIKAARLDPIVALRHE